MSPHFVFDGGLGGGSRVVRLKRRRYYMVQPMGLLPLRPDQAVRDAEYFNIGTPASKVK